MESICKTCIYGHCFKGKIVHRAAKIGTPGPMPEFPPEYDDDYEDYMDPEEKDSEKPIVKIEEQYLDTVTTVCYFPFNLTEGAILPQGFESYAFSDGIITECNQYKKIKV